VQSAATTALPRFRDFTGLDYCSTNPVVFGPSNAENDKMTTDIPVTGGSPLSTDPAQDPRWPTAIHEAGHVVAAFASGLATDSATIRPDGDSLGVREFPGPRFGYEFDGELARRATIRREVVCFYAGLAAQHVLLGHPFSFDEDAQDGAWGDHDSAWQLLMTIPIRGAGFVGDDAYDRALVRSQREAIQLIRRNREGVGRVARALIERETLNASEIEALCEGAR
jgi:hypothetical protein